MADSCTGAAAARSHRERMRSQAEADLAELEKKREELQGLLGRRD